MKTNACLKTPKKSLKVIRKGQFITVKCKGYKPNYDGELELYADLVGVLSDLMGNTLQFVPDASTLGCLSNTPIWFDDGKSYEQMLSTVIYYPNYMIGNIVEYGVGILEIAKSTN